jgi:hypothetical protein
VAGLAWVLWALAMLGLAVFASLDQLLRQAGRPDLLVLTPKVIPPCSGRWAWPRSEPCWPAAGPATRLAGCCWPSACP